MLAIYMKCANDFASQLIRWLRPSVSTCIACSRHCLSARSALHNSRALDLRTRLGSQHEVIKTLHMTPTMLFSALQPGARARCVRSTSYSSSYTDVRTSAGCSCLTTAKQVHLYVTGSPLNNHRPTDAGREHRCQWTQSRGLQPVL